MRNQKQIKKLISSGFGIYDFSKSAGVTILCRWSRGICIFRSVFDNGVVLNGLVIF
jgi:hypothetical protein